MAATKKKTDNQEYSPQVDFTTRVVYIHGIGAQHPPADLKREWDKALFEKLMGAQTCFAYWADILHPECAAGEAKVAMRAGPFNALSIPKELISIITDRTTPSSGAEKQYTDAMMGKLNKRLTRIQGNVANLKGWSRLPDPLRGMITEWIIKAFIKDTAAYFFNEPKRDEMRKRLRSVLAEVKNPIILVAHSQGSIIAYDVLREMEPSNQKIALLVTIGSPLGYPEVQDEIEKPLQIPAVVESWSNFADLLDIVAMDKDLADDFTTHARKINDMRVVNLDFYDGPFGPHSGAGYLRTRQVRAAVQDTLKSL